MRPFPKREHLTLPHKKDGEWDYLTIYSRDGAVLSHSEAHHTGEWIRHTYEGIEYVVSPDGEILLTFASLEAKYAPK